MSEKCSRCGATPIGRECVDCREYVSNAEITPAGLCGVVLGKAMRLVGPHGGWGQTSRGESYIEQIVDEDGKLEIIRPSDIGQ